MPSPNSSKPVKASKLSAAKLAEIEASVSPADVTKELDRKIMSRPGLAQIFNDRGGVPASIKDAFKKSLVNKRIHKEEAAL